MGASVDEAFLPRSRSIALQREAWQAPLVMGGGDLRRFGIVGDVHGEHVSLERAMLRLRREGAERVLCVGDVVDGGDVGSVDRCCELLAADDVTCVRGNHERWLFAGTMRELADATPLDSLAASSLAFLRALPTSARFSTELGPLLLCHGLGDDDMARLMPFDEGYALADNDALQRTLGMDLGMLVNGHSHVRMVRTIAGTVFVNAGTLHRAFDPCFGLVDLDARTVRFFDLGDGGVTEGDTFRFGQAGDDVWGGM